MSNAQPGIMADVPRVGRYLFYSRRAGADPKECLEMLSALAPMRDVVVGLGAESGVKVEGLKAFPSYQEPGAVVPATPAALWCWLRGEDRGELVKTTRELDEVLAPAFESSSVVDAFRHKEGRDLTGYEDGTENPTGAEATAAAFGPSGASFVAVQTWVHDLAHFESLPRKEGDHIIGRRLSDNEELEDAPESAHVKRTAQESFSPEAFMLRRSMPYTAGRESGLVFVAFGHSVDAFEAQLRRMVGLEDGITDALFRFSRPVTGAYFWCPPISGGTLDLSAAGL